MDVQAVAGSGGVFGWCAGCTVMAANGSDLGRGVGGQGITMALCRAPHRSCCTPCVQDGGEVVYRPCRANRRTCSDVGGLEQHGARAHGRWVRRGRRAAWPRRPRDHGSEVVRWHAEAPNLGLIVNQSVNIFRPNIRARCGRYACATTIIVTRTPPASIPAPPKRCTTSKYTVLDCSIWCRIRRRPVPAGERG